MKTLFNNILGVILFIPSMVQLHKLFKKWNWNEW